MVILMGLLSSMPGYWPPGPFWWPEAGNGVCANGVHTSYQEGVGLLDSSSVQIRWETPLPDAWVSNNTSGPVVWDVDNDGVPEVLVAYAGDRDSKLVVMDGPTGVIEWIWTTPGLRVSDLTPPVADLDGDGHPEIVMLNQDAGDIDSFMIYAIDGVTRQVDWKRRLVDWTRPVGPYCGIPTIGDADNDGKPEVLVWGGRDGQDSLFCLNGEDGSVLWARDSIWSRIPVCGDVNGDGEEEVIGSRMSDGRVMALSGTDGSLIWQADTAISLDGGASIADVDGDGKTEVVFPGYLRGPNITCLDGETGATKWVYTPNKRCFTHMLLSVAQLDQDQSQEVLDWFRGPRQTTCLDGAWGTQQWVYPTNWDGYDNSSEAVADVDNDGENEIITLRVNSGWPYSYKLVCLNGLGNPEWVFDFAISEYCPAYHPILADVDNDGYLEIVLQPEGRENPTVRCIDNERALTAEEETSGRKPELKALPGRIVLSLPESYPVDLSLFDMAGRKVQQLWNGVLGPGEHQFPIGNLEPGIYMARASFDGTLITKLVVIKRR